VVSFTARQFYSLVKTPQYPLGLRTGLDAVVKRWNHQSSSP